MSWERCGPSQRVVRRDSTGQVESFFEPSLISFRPEPDRLRAIGSGDHRHDANDDEIPELVDSINVASWVVQMTEAVENGVDFRELVFFCVTH